MPEYEEITPQEFEEEQAKIKNAEHKSGFSWLMLQTWICVLLLAFLLVMKFLVPTVYSEICDWYNSEMERLVLIEYDDSISSL